MMVLLANFWSSNRLPGVPYGKPQEWWPPPAFS